MRISSAIGLADVVGGAPGISGVAVAGGSSVRVVVVEKRREEHVRPHAGLDHTILDGAAQTQALPSAEAAPFVLTRLAQSIQQAAATLFQT